MLHLNYFCPVNRAISELGTPWVTKCSEANQLKCCASYWIALVRLLLLAHVRCYSNFVCSMCFGACNVGPHKMCNWPCLLCFQLHSAAWFSKRKPEHSDPPFPVDQNILLTDRFSKVYGPRWSVLLDMICSFSPLHVLTNSVLWMQLNIIFTYFSSKW